MQILAHMDCAFSSSHGKGSRAILHAKNLKLSG